MNPIIRAIMEEKIGTIEMLLKALEDNLSVQQSKEALQALSKLKREFNQAKNQLLKM